MELILKASLLYLFILLIFRMSGKRTLSKMTTFDFVLLLIVGEATQQALLSDDNSLLNAVLVITILITLDVVFSVTAQKWDLFNKVTNGVPVVLIDNGQLLTDRMNKARVEADDILESARRIQGLESLDQVKYAVLERDGQISIIPKYVSRSHDELTSHSS